MRAATILFLFIIMFFTVATYAQKAKRKAMQWKIAAELPAAIGQVKALGLAGPVAGVHDNKLIIGGGANFPDNMPWNGGKKKYYDEVFVFEKNTNKKLSLLVTKQLSLKQKLAYSGNVSTSDGIVCIGGETDTGHTNKVFILKWDNSRKNININELPSLPVKLANAAVTNIGQTIYVAGGDDGQQAVNTFFQFDMSASPFQWKELPPMTVSLSHAVAVAQSNGKNDCVYVIGGRTKTTLGLSELHSTVFCYDPVNNNWKQLSDISDGKQVTNMSAATAVAVDETFILLMGGDKGTIFRQIETFNIKIVAAKTTKEKEQLTAEKIKLLNEHPGFSKDVLAYNTVQDCWIKVSELPYGPVTTTAVKWKDDIFIPSGEIKPGRRTPQILSGRLKRSIKNSNYCR